MGVGRLLPLPTQPSSLTHLEEANLEDTVAKHIHYQGLQAG